MSGRLRAMPMDRTDHAAAELGRRSVRLRRTVAGLLTLAGLAVGAIGYIELRGFFLGRFGMSSPIAVATLTVLPALALALRLIRPTSAIVLAGRREAWWQELAQDYGLDRAQFDDLMAILGESEAVTPSEG